MAKQNSKIPKMKFKPVCVTWNDITETSGWHDEDDLDAHLPMTITTLGWLIRENLETIWLTPCLVHEDDCEPFGSVLAIPMGCVVSVKKI